ncbi:glycosyltransferase [Amycolatopsis regifaucium]|uniref:Glycosyl transferase n=1 Tax=Amycolatopsis regifaucium TaxID=546365 RepID=A0A154MDI1_9PSEU|nr:nucleotide disphospho-sugar-binding domain-containing protein [Amycolatopsis regifaucium]KZB82601.1 glycosyl transferase [Amycolatopsis regifaucium]OKA06469.1 glycosyl transferase [Amycolatopsis regifaucium]SFG87061.1 glycosyltransferase, MGT family [Amycolatopsis regifaucium]
MRLIFTSLVSHGHLYPLLPLAVAARDAGHDVLFATGEDMRPVVEKAGLAWESAGFGMREAFASFFGPDAPPRDPTAPPESFYPVIGQVFGNVLPRRFVADLTPLLERHRPDLVVYESGNAGGAIAARLAGIPAIGHGFGRVSPGEVMDIINGHIEDYANEIGVDGVKLTSFGDPVIDICPESVQSPDFLAETNRIPLRPVGWAEPGDLPAGVVGRDKSRPLIYLTLGTAFGDEGVLKRAIAGLARLEADVVVAAGPTVEPAQLGEVPANVRVEAWVPQTELLPHVDLVVHHGGSGTTLGAFGAALPQLVLPQGADQFTNAEAVVAAGVGGQLIGAEGTEDAIFEQSRKLLADDGVRAAARKLADEVAAMPSPAEVAARLPEFAG